MPGILTAGFKRLPPLQLLLKKRNRKCSAVVSFSSMAKYSAKVQQPGDFFTVSVKTVLDPVVGDLLKHLRPFYVANLPQVISNAAIDSPSDSALPLLQSRVSKLKIVMLYSIVDFLTFRSGFFSHLRKN